MATLEKSNKYKLEYELLLKNHASKEAKRAQKELERLTNKSKDAKGQYKALNIESGNLLGSSKKLKAGLAGVAVVAGVALYKSFRAAVEEGGRLEQSLANLNAIANPTADQFNVLQQQARALGKSTAFTADEAANAFTELAKLGLTTTEIIASSNSVLNLAAATGNEMSETATVMAQTLGQFGLSADEATRVTDVMSKSFTTSALDMRKFAEAMKFAGPVAKSTGTSLEEATAAISVLSNSAIDGSNAGTAMRRVMLELSDSGSKASKALKAAGLDGADTFTEKLQALASMNLTAAQRTEMFGLIATTAAGVLIDNAKATDETSRSIDNYTKQLQGASGATKEMADKQLDSLQGQMKLTKSAISEVWLTLYDTFGPALKDLVAELPGTFNKIAKAIDAWGPVLTTVNNVLVKTVGLMIRLAEVIPDTITQAGAGLQLLGGDQDDLDRFNEQNRRAGDAANDYNKALQELTETARMYKESQKALAEGSINAEDLADAYNELSRSMRRVQKLNAIGLASEKEAARLAKQVDSVDVQARNFFTSRNAEGNKARQSADVAAGTDQYVSALSGMSALGGGSNKKQDLSFGQRSGIFKDATLEGMRAQADRAAFARSMDSAGMAGQSALEAQKKKMEEERALLVEQNETMAQLNADAKKTEMERLTEEYQQKKDLYEYHQIETTNLTEQFAKKRAEIEKEQAMQSLGQLQQIFGITKGLFSEHGEAYKAFAIGETVISTSLAIMKILSQGGMFAVPLATAVGIQGAMQVSKIASQKFFSGGYVERENSSDNVMINAQPGEVVMSRAMVNNMTNAVKGNGTGMAGMGQASQGSVTINQYFKSTDPIIASRRSRADADRASRRRSPALAFGEGY